MSSRRALRCAWLAGVVAVLAAAATPACKTGGGPKGVADGAATGAAAPLLGIETPGGRVTFRVELARTAGEREQGLMYRERLASDAGMLFVFDRPSPLVFWMKNTFIPLDMIFIGEDRHIVGIVAQAEPRTLTPRRVDEPSQYVLEIGGGLAARMGIRPGQRVDFPDFGPAP